MKTSLSAFLAAPCRFCDYNSQGYWQAHTHARTCPFHGIGGAAERERFLIKHPALLARAPKGPEKEFLGAPARASWPQVMAGIAAAAAKRSRDATTKVGAVVCDANHRVLGTGYNGPPAGSPMALTMEGPARHAHVVHAEINAVLQAIAAQGRWPLEVCALYCTHRPCAACLRFMAHCGIKKAVYACDTLDVVQALEAVRWEATMGVTVVWLGDLPAEGA